MTVSFLTEEQQDLQVAARRIASQRIAPLAAELDRTDEFPHELFDQLGKLGYLGATCPPDVGGSGLDAVSVALMLEEISAASGAVGSSVNAHISLACAVIARHGNEEQRQAYLPDLAVGRTLGAFCLTEPSGGSDTAGLLTRARRSEDGYVLSGSKSFITNATVADVLVVTARTGGQDRNGVSAFVIDRHLEGVSVGALDHKHGMHGSPTAPVFFDDVAIPASSLLGEEGDGLRQFGRVLEQGRINVAALAVGLGRAALEMAVGYARERRAFGKPIGAYQGIQWPLAEAATDLEAARLLTLNAARLADTGHPIREAASMAKFHAVEASLRAANSAVEIFGGAGYMVDTGVERILRDAKMYQIGEGTSQIQRLVIARGLLGRLPE